MTTELGTGYRDKVTGFRGTAIAEVRYLTGQVDVCLQALNADGEPIEMWVSKERLTEPS